MNRWKAHYVRYVQIVFLEQNMGFPYLCWLLAGNPTDVDFHLKTTDSGSFDQTSSPVISHYLKITLRNLSETRDFLGGVPVCPSRFRRFRDTLATPLDVMSRARPSKPDHTLMAGRWAKVQLFCGENMM